MNEKILFRKLITFCNRAFVIELRNYEETEISQFETSVWLFPKGVYFCLGATLQFINKQFIGMIITRPFYMGEIAVTLKSLKHI